LAKRGRADHQCLLDRIHRPHGIRPLAWQKFLPGILPRTPFYAEMGAKTRIPFAPFFTCRPNCFQAVITRDTRCIGSLGKNEHDVVGAVAVESRHCLEVFSHSLTVASFQSFAQLLDCVAGDCLACSTSCLFSCFGELLLPSSRAEGAMRRNRGNKSGEVPSSRSKRVASGVTQIWWHEAC